MKKDVIITIARQFGCGGRSVGKMLAEKMGIGYYDNELITLAAKQNDVDQEFYKDFDEKAGNRFSGMFAFTVPTTGYYMPVYSDLQINDRLFFTQAGIIKAAADKPCIFVGRCADYILRDRKNLVRVFLYADEEARINRLTNIYKVEHNNMQKLLKKADKQRANYYNTYTDTAWGDPKNYDICINTTNLDVAGVANVIMTVVDNFKQ